MSLSKRYQTAIVGFLMAASTAVGAERLLLDGRREGRTFEGIGAVSAGASSRLLIDYPEPQRSRVLDYLFKPNYGAGFQHLKVEVGGDVNSTDGCEASHMHSRHEENYSRGYEWWLMKEAKKRNPNIVLDCLAWGAPGWIGNGKFFSQDMADYLVKFIEGAKKVHGLEIQYVGIWNERKYDVDWIKLLRQTLDQHGLRQVEVVAPDMWSWELAEMMEKDVTLRQSIQILGVHYPRYQSTPAAQACGKPLWSSEDGPWSGQWLAKLPGSGPLAQLFPRNYVVGRQALPAFTAEWGG